MDETNGPIFDHHEELFAQIGSADAEQELDKFMLEMTGSSLSHIADGSGRPSDIWPSSLARVPDALSFSGGINSCPDPNSMTQRNIFQANEGGLPFSMQMNSSHDASVFLDGLDIMDSMNGLDAIKRSLMAIPEKPLAEQPAGLRETMHRISTDNGTQEYLDSLSKAETDSKQIDHVLWNGAAAAAADHCNFQSSAVSKSMPVSNSIVRNIDRNGNCPNVFNNGLSERTKLVGVHMDMRNHDVTKSRLGFSGIDNIMLNPEMGLLNQELTKPCLPLNTNDLLNREFSQNYMTKGLSPSVSADSAIHTPTTSYDSASPMSSGRTPLRSDDSISPLASCASPVANVRTPLRTDDCFSPGRVRRPDASPIIRTPIRCDETPSPRPAIRTAIRSDDVPSPGRSRTAVRNDDVIANSPPVRMPASPAAPSPRAIARTPLRPDEAPSPRAVTRTPLRTDDALSPRGLSRTPLRMDGDANTPSPRGVNWTSLRGDEALSPRTPNRTPLRNDEAPSPRGPGTGRTPLRTDEALSPRTAVNRPAIRPDEMTSSRSTVSRNPLRPEEAPSLWPPFASMVRTEDFVNRPQQQQQQPPPLGPDLNAFIASRVPYNPGFLRIKDGEGLMAADMHAGAALTAGPVLPFNQQSPLSACSSSSWTLATDADDPSTSGLSVPAKPKKRRKTDSLCVPTVKKRANKKMLIYQSSVSPDNGIKLKFTLTNMPPPRRRRRKTDEAPEKPNKRRKRVTEPFAEQSPWGRDLPPLVLEQIFKCVVADEGCVPSLVRFCLVCRQWNSVASKAELWQNVDLSSPCIKQKFKIDRYFRWLLENRMGPIRDLNLNGWKFSNLPMVLSLVGTHCSDVESIGLSGWQGLHFEHLRSLLVDCPRLTRIDLSDVSPESKSTNSAVSPKSLTHLTETMGERLTELTLSHNTLSCLPQIITSLATNCPNLQVLDLSNIRRASHAEFALHVEELQMGCPRLRVLRITNSCVTIATVPFDQQAASPGFPALEELSIAGHQGTESLRITSVMDDDCLERIVKNSRKLRLLDVRGCTRITESSLVRVPAWDIQHLFLSGCLITRQSGSGLELITQKWRHSLIEIDMAWASFAEDVNAAVTALAENGSESPLRVVDLCGSAVEPAPVKTLLMGCPQLESLNLQSCRGLPRGVKRLYERDQLPELLELLQQSLVTGADG